MKNIYFRFLFVCIVSFSTKVFADAGIFDGWVIIAGTTYELAAVKGYPSVNNHDFGIVPAGNSLALSFAETNVWHNMSGNICSGEIHFRVFGTGSTQYAGNWHTVANMNYAGQYDVGTASDHYKWNRTVTDTFLTAGLAEGTYKVEFYATATGGDNGGCSSTYYLSNGGQNYTATFTVAYTDTVWNGAVWSNGEPDSTKRAIIDGDYSSVSFTAGNLVVNAGKNLTVNNDITVNDKLINNGNITVANAKNFLQIRSGADANQTNNGATFSLIRDSKPLSRLDYVAWASPVSGQQTLQQFSPGTISNRFYSYSGGSYVAVSPSNTFIPGAGYQIRSPNNFPAAPATLIFTGKFIGNKPNNGDILYDAAPVAGDYVLLGNPYPTNLDAEAFYAANSSAMDGTFYFWNSAAKMTGNTYTANLYTTYNKTGTVPAASGNGIIQISQGFIVKRPGANPGNVYQFTNAMRTVASSALKMSNSARANSSAGRYWLQLTSPSGNISQVLIGYGGGTKSWDDGYDATLLDVSAGTLYMPLDKINLIINGRGIFDSSDTIPLALTPAETGSYKLEVVQAEGLFAGSQHILIKNSITGLTYDITTSAMEITAAAGDKVDGLSVVYTDSTLEVIEPAKPAVKIYAANGTLFINSPIKTLKKASIYDMSGRKIAHWGGTARTLELKLPATDGIAIVSLEFQDSTVFNRKIKF